MLLFVYLILFVALSAALTWWRVISYQRRFELAPHPLRRSKMPAARNAEKRKLG